MKYFMQYVDKDSFLHRLNPLTKLILAVSLCIITFCTKSLVCLLCILAFNLLIGAAGSVFKQALGILKGLLKLSAVLFLCQIFFVSGGEVLLFLPLGLKITAGGLYVSTLIVLRLICATMPLTLMLSVTRANDLLNALTVKLHIPYKYAFSIMTAVRFIPVFSAEMQGIMDAQIVRGVDFDTKNIFKKISLILPLCVPLLITSVRKIENSAISAELRGFSLHTRDTVYKTYPMQTADILLCVLCVLAVLAFILVPIVM